MQFPPTAVIKVLWNHSFAINDRIGSPRERTWDINAGVMIGICASCLQVCAAAAGWRCWGQREDGGVQDHPPARGRAARPGGARGAPPGSRSRRAGHEPRGGDPSERRLLRRREALRGRALPAGDSEAAGRGRRPQDGRQEAAHTPPQRMCKLQLQDREGPPAAWGQGRCGQLCRIHADGLFVTGRSRGL